MAAVAAQQTIVVPRAAVRRTAGAAPTKVVGLGGSSRVSSSSVLLGPRRRGVKATRASVSATRTHTPCEPQITSLAPAAAAAPAPSARTSESLDSEKSRALLSLSGPPHLPN